MPAAPTITVTVRYFAAARAAAGVDSETLDLAADAGVETLVRELAGRSTELATVLSRCSYLCDGIAVRDLRMALRDHLTVDVLPPFAGG